MGSQLTFMRYGLCWVYCLTTLRCSLVYMGSDFGIQLCSGSNFVDVLLATALMVVNYDLIFVIDGIRST